MTADDGQFWQFLPTSIATAATLAYVRAMECALDREPLTDELWLEAHPLLVAHWAEVAHFPDIPLAPDRDVYAGAERAGIIRCYTARVPGEGLVGYALFFVRPNPHYAGSLQAMQDVVYVAHAHRGRLAVMFLEFCDARLKAEGVQVVRQHFKAAHDHAHLMAKLGYEVEDRIYVKRLDR